MEKVKSLFSWQARGACLILASCFGSTLNGLDYGKEVRPLLEKYCYDCHGDGAKKGDVVLDTFDDVKIRMSSNMEWKRIWSVLDDRQMPPPNKKQPNEDERERILHWIEKEVFRHDCDNPDPGRVTIRRLNREEYGNTVRDLFGLRKDFRPEDKFPVDDSGYGFDNIGDVLTVAPVLMEKYISAADEILEEALALTPPPPRKQRFTAQQMRGHGLFRDGHRILVSNGEAHVTLEAPLDGEYILRFHGFGDQAGGEKVKVGLLLNGKQVGVLTVPQTRNNPGTHETKVKVAKGRWKVGAAFLNDYYMPKHPNPRQRDRNLHIRWLEVEGPIGLPPPDVPQSHKDIFFTDAKKAGGAEKAARSILSIFTSRAYRRPVREDELDRLMNLYSMAQKDGLSFTKAVALAMKAVLISPHFLFRGETQPSPDNPQVVHRVDEFALASRLSYFLWGTMPDHPLLRRAWKGELRRNFDTEVRRMLADERSGVLARNFAGQWLELRNLDKVMPDQKRFPTFTKDLAADMRRETELLFQHIQRQDRSVMEFLEADYTYVNQRLAKHYGMPKVPAGDFTRVSLKGTGRVGLLTHASILTITSNPTRTSPVKRGKWILENLLGLPPPPPDPNAPSLPSDGKALQAFSLREIMEKHRKDPVCAACHANMDPIGLAFENFDAIGVWRDKDGKFPIDPSGKLASGRFVNGPDQLRALLARDYRGEYLRCLTEMLLTFALGRGLEYYDRCTVNQIVESLQKNEYRFSTLVMGIVHSDPFQKRRGDGNRLAVD